MVNNSLEEKSKEPKIKVISPLFREVLLIPKSYFERALKKDASVAGFEGEGFYVSPGFDFYASKHVFDGLACE